MAITEKKIIEGTCDLCDESIDTSKEYIDASVYGAAFHNECWNGLDFTPKTVCRALGLDDIVVVRTNENGYSQDYKAIYTS